MGARRERAVKVLIAEDDTSQRRLLRHYLKKWGYAYEEAADGADAISALDDPQICLAVLDWEMPRATGLDVCRYLGRLGRFVHAIILTARSSKGELAEALEAGASDFLPKPVDATELRARLQVGARSLRLVQEISLHRQRESQSSLATGLAHEMNTPVQALLSNLEFLRDSWCDTENLLSEIGARGPADCALPAQAQSMVRAACERADLEFLQEEIPRALDQSRDALESISRIVRVVQQASSGLAESMQSLSLREVLEDAVALARDSWESRAKLELELAPDLGRVFGCRSALVQCFCALIANASEAVASRPGPGSIRVEGSGETESVRIQVSDDGCGIDPAIRHRIFDPFFSTKGEGAGMGNGLALAQSVILNQHGGSLCFSSEVGRGTRFDITLPRRPPQT